MSEYVSETCQRYSDPTEGRISVFLGFGPKGRRERVPPSSQAAGPELLVACILAVTGDLCLPGVRQALTPEQ